MATFYDDIVAGIVSLFNSSMNCDIHENVALFITSMVFQSDPSATVFNLSAKFKKYIAQNRSKFHSGPTENIPKNVYSHIWSHHPK